MKNKMQRFLLPFKANGNLWAVLSASPGDQRWLVNTTALGLASPDDNDGGRSRCLGNAEETPVTYTSGTVACYFQLFFPALEFSQQRPEATVRSLGINHWNKSSMISNPAF